MEEIETDRENVSVSVSVKSNSRDKKGSNGIKGIVAGSEPDLEMYFLTKAKEI